MSLFRGLLVCPITLCHSFFFLLVPCCFGYCSSLTNSCATDLRSQKPVGELGIELQINIRIEVLVSFVRECIPRAANIPFNIHLFQKAINGFEKPFDPSCLRRGA